MDQRQVHDKLVNDAELELRNLDIILSATKKERDNKEKEREVLEKKVQDGQESLGSLIIAKDDLQGHLTELDRGLSERRKANDDLRQSLRDAEDQADQERQRHGAARDKYLSLVNQRVMHTIPALFQQASRQAGLE